MLCFNKSIEKYFLLEYLERYKGNRFSKTKKNDRKKEYLLLALAEPVMLNIRSNIYTQIKLEIKKLNKTKENVFFLCIMFQKI